MDEFILRPARETESSQIKALIHLSGINPTGLDWKRFLVIVNARGQVIACGQVKPHGKDVKEMASIAVHPDYQGRGLARRVIEALLSKNPRPLHLMCLSRMSALYEKFGFRALAYEEMPRYFQRLTKVVEIVDYLRRSGDGLSVMKLE